MTYKFPALDEGAVAPYPVGAMHLSPDYAQDLAVVSCVDSPLFSFSFWINLRNGSGQRPVYFFDPDGGAFTSLYLAEGRLNFTFGLVDGSVYFDFSADEVLVQNEWHHILGSVKCDEAVGEKIIALYVDDANMPVTVGTDGASLVPELNGIALRIGGASDEGAEIDLAEFWLAVGQTLLADDDIPEATRRKFIDANGWPVDLGVAGATPTGTAPTFFLRLAADSGTGFLANLGTGGGPFVAGEDGEMVPAPHRPSDPPRLFNNPMFARNDLIVGGSYGAPGRIAAPPTTGTFALQCIDGVMTWVEVP